MTVAPQAQAETEIVTGMIQGIVQKGQDKWQVEVNTGGQNPRRLWTKDPNLVQALQYQIGQQQTFLCGISHWTNNQGQPVRSLWINGVGQGAVAAQPQVAPQPLPQQPAAMGVPTPAPQQFPAQPPPQPPTIVQPTAVPMAGMIPQAQPPQQPQATVGPRYDEYLRPHSPQTEAKIHRQTATKVAALLLQNFPEQERTYDTLIIISERLLAYYEHGIQLAHNGNPQAGGDPGSEGYVPTDDDIPF